MRPHRQAPVGCGGGSRSRAQNFSFTSDDFEDRPPNWLQYTVGRKNYCARFYGSISYWLRLRISTLDDYVPEKGSESASKDYLNASRSVAGEVSGVQTALFRKGKGIEALMTVERIGVLSSFEPVYDKIRDRGSENLITDLQSIAGKNNVKEDAGGIDSAEGKSDNKNRVDGLADDCGADGAGPEPASVGEEFEPRHGVGVCELAGPEGDKAGRQDSWNEAEDGREGLLIMPAWSGGQSYNDGSDEIEKGCTEEAQPDGSSGGGKAVNLGEDVSEDVGNGKKENRSADRERAHRPVADREWAKEADLLGDEV